MLDLEPNKICYSIKKKTWFNIIFKQVNGLFMTWMDINWLLLLYVSIMCTLYYCCSQVDMPVLLFDTLDLACAFTIDKYWQIIHHKTHSKVLALNCKMLGWGFIYPYRHDITEILLKVALNTINLNPNLFTHKQNQQYVYVDPKIQYYFIKFCNAPVKSRLP